MNPFPTPVLNWPVAMNGYLEVMLLASVGATMIVFGMMLWRAWPTVRERLTLLCPVRLRRARVTFELAPTGERIDIRRCSIFGRRPVTCGKVCMQTAARA